MVKSQNTLKITKRKKTPKRSVKNEPKSKRQKISRPDNFDYIPDNQLFLMDNVDSEFQQEALQEYNKLIGPQTNDEDEVENLTRAIIQANIKTPVEEYDTKPKLSYDDGIDRGYIHSALEYVVTALGSSLAFTIDQLARLLSGLAHYTRGLTAISQTFKILERTTRGVKLIGKMGFKLLFKASPNIVGSIVSLCLGPMIGHMMGAWIGESLWPNFTITNQIYNFITAGTNISLAGLAGAALGTPLYVLFTARRNSSIADLIMLVDVPTASWSEWLLRKMSGAILAAASIFAISYGFSDPASSTGIISTLSTYFATPGSSNLWNSVNLILKAFNFTSSVTNIFSGTVTGFLMGALNLFFMYLALPSAIPNATNLAQGTNIDILAQRSEAITKELENTYSSYTAATAATAATAVASQSADFMGKFSATAKLAKDLVPDFNVPQNVDIEGFANWLNEYAKPIRGRELDYNVFMARNAITTKWPNSTPPPEIAEFYAEITKEGVTDGIFAQATAKLSGSYNWTMNTLFRNEGDSWMPQIKPSNEINIGNLVRNIGDMPSPDNPAFGKVAVEVVSNAQDAIVGNIITETLSKDPPRVDSWWDIAKYYTELVGSYLKYFGTSNYAILCAYILAAVILIWVVSSIWRRTRKSPAPTLESVEKDRLTKYSSMIQGVNSLVMMIKNIRITIVTNILSLNNQATKESIIFSMDKLADMFKNNNVITSSLDELRTVVIGALDNVKTDGLVPPIVLTQTVSLMIKKLKILVEQNSLGSINTYNEGKEHKYVKDQLNNLAILLSLMDILNISIVNEYRMRGLESSFDELTTILNNTIQEMDGDNDPDVIKQLMQSLKIYYYDNIKDYKSVSFPRIESIITLQYSEIDRSIVENIKSDNALYKNNVEKLGSDLMSLISAYEIDVFTKETSTLLTADVVDNTVKESMEKLQIQILLEHDVFSQNYTRFVDFYRSKRNTTQTITDIYLLLDEKIKELKEEVVSIKNVDYNDEGKGAVNVINYLNLTSLIVNVLFKLDTMGLEKNDINEFKAILEEMIKSRKRIIRNINISFDSLKRLVDKILNIANPTATISKDTMSYIVGKARALLELYQEANKIKLVDVDSYLVRIRAENAIKPQKPEWIQQQEKSPNLIRSPNAVPQSPMPTIPESDRIVVKDFTVVTNLEESIKIYNQEKPNIDTTTLGETPKFETEYAEPTPLVEEELVVLGSEDDTESIISVIENQNYVGKEQEEVNEESATTPKTCTSKESCVKSLKNITKCLEMYTDTLGFFMDTINMGVEIMNYPRLQPGDLIMRQGEEPITIVTGQEQTKQGDDIIRKDADLVKLQRKKLIDNVTAEYKKLDYNDDIKTMECSQITENLKEVFSYLNFLFVNEDKLKTEHINYIRALNGVPKILKTLIQTIEDESQRNSTNDIFENITVSFTSSMEAAILALDMP